MACCCFEVLIWQLIWLRKWISRVANFQENPWRNFETCERDNKICLVDKFASVTSSAPESLCLSLAMLNGGDSVSRQVSGPRPPVFVTRSHLGTEPESDCGGRNFSEEKICNKNLGKLRLTSHLSSQWFLFGIKPPLLAQWSQGLRSFGQRERKRWWTSFFLSPQHL